MVLIALLLAAPTTPPGVPLKQIESPTACASRIAEAAHAFDSGKAADDAGDPATAERFYKDAIAKDPKLCDAFDHLGRLARQAGKLDEALDWYRKSLAIKPDNEVAQLNLASAFLLQGNVRVAVAE